MGGGVINHFFSSGVYAKETRIPAGQVLVQHAHKYDHLSILAQGSVEVLVDGKKKILHAPACLTIEANKHHGVKSLTDVIWYCIHATSCADEDEIDEVLIAPGDMATAQAIASTLQKEF
jgi:quercetin dioxygenase-like cupin family protein